MGACETENKQKYTILLITFLGSVGWLVVCTGTALVTFYFTKIHKTKRWLYILIIIVRNTQSLAWRRRPHFSTFIFCFINDGIIFSVHCIISINSNLKDERKILISRECGYLLSWAAFGIRYTHFEPRARAFIPSAAAVMHRTEREKC